MKKWSETIESNNLKAILKHAEFILEHQEILFSLEQSLGKRVASVTENLFWQLAETVDIEMAGLKGQKKAEYDPYVRPDDIVPLSVHKESYEYAYGVLNIVMNSVGIKSMKLDGIDSMGGSNRESLGKKLKNPELWNLPTEIYSFRAHPRT